MPSSPSPVNVGVLATQLNTVILQPAGLYVLNLVMTVQIALLSHVLVPVIVAPIRYFIRAALPMSLNLR